MAVGVRIDPYHSFNFLVEIDGLVVGGFSEVTGLQAEIEVHDYREGGLNEYMHRLAGPVRYPGNLILKRGVTDNLSLWLWHKEVRNGTVNRRNVSILLRGTSGQLARVWHLDKAWPVKWNGPELRAEGNTVAVESLELAHCGFSLV